MFRRSVLSYVGFAMLGALALYACGSDPKPAPYLGHWESLYRGRGGVANGLVFRADSTMDRLTFRAFEFRYSIEGDSLHLVPQVDDSFLPPGDTVPPVITSYFSVTGDTLVRSDTDHTKWLVREAGPESAEWPLLGTWRAVRATSPRAPMGFERFRADSLLQVRVPAGVIPGTYRMLADDDDTLRPDSIYIFLPNDTSRCVLSWRADTLVLTRTFNNGTFSFDYVRAGEASWYRPIAP